MTKTDFDVLKELDIVSSSIDKVKLEIASYEFDKSSKVTNDTIEDNTITIVGKYHNECSSSCFSDKINVKALMSLDAYEAGIILNALGTKERYLIIKSLLESPKTVNELVKELHFDTTGKAYHHINVLVAANIINKTSTNKYVVGSSFVGGILMIIAGINNLMRKRKHTNINLDDLKQ